MTTEPTLPEGVEHVIIPRAHDIGGFEVRRALPAKERQMVGPLIFFDQMGPGEFLTGKGLDVRPHPHIGLSTVTYLFAGEIMHRDSAGQPAADRAGRRELDDRRARHRAFRTHRQRRSATASIRCSASSPGSPCRETQEETAPAFVHHPAATLPTAAEAGMRMRLIAGHGLGAGLARRGLLAALLRRCRTRARRAHPAAGGARGTRRLCRAGQRRRRRHALRGGADAAVPRRRCAGDHGGRGRRAAADAGRRDDGRAAPPVLELRLLLPRADRAGEAGLEGDALRCGARR